MRQPTRTKLAAMIIAIAAVTGGLSAAAQPGSPDTAGREARHVVLKLREGTDLGVHEGHVVSPSGRFDSSGVDAAIGRARGTVKRKFSETPATKPGNANLGLYFDVDLPSGDDVGRLLDDLNALDMVETAYLPSTASAPEVTPVMTQGQYYARPAPGGLDSDYASALPGGDGSSVRIVDVEQGWNFSHEDLTLPSNTLVSGVNLPSSVDHGTAVLGEMVARANGIGVTGMVPGATVRASGACRELQTPGLSPDAHPSNPSNDDWREPRVGAGCARYDVAAAIVDAASHLLASGVQGKVILIEQQTGATLYPMEIEQAVYDSIRNAVSNGIVVVEAAGNGRRDLDAYTDSATGQHVLRRSVRDSGAIMVGAGCPPSTPYDECPDRTAINNTGWGSNYGSRVDVQGYGERIITLGYGNGYGQATGDPNRYYTHTFGGTSGASPMVTSAAAAIQGWHIATFGSAVSPPHIRSLLRDTGTAQPAGDAAARPIGPLPDLGRTIGVKWWDWAERVEGVEFLAVSSESSAFTPALRLSASTSSTRYGYTLPGITSIKEVSIAASKGTLTVSGKLPATRSEPARAFSRASALPKGANTDAMTSTYAKGVLTVTIPRA